MKRCPKCSRDLDEALFSRKGEGLQPYCKDCNRRQKKAWYDSNAAEQIAKIKARQERISAESTEYVNSLKAAPCMDCGGKFNPWQMDYDHRDPATKIKNVSAMVREAYSLELIKKEIDKCDLVCANCHRNRTHWSVV